MAQNNLAIKQLLIGFQREPVRNWDRDRFYEMIRLITNDLGQDQTNIETLQNQVKGLIPAGGDEEVMTHGQVMRRISVRI